MANKIWYIEDYQLKEYPGTYHEYEIFQEQREKDQKKAGLKPEKPVAKEEAKTKSCYRMQNANPALQQELKKANNQLKEIEKQVQDLERELANYETQLADPQVYGNVNTLKDITLKFEKTKKELDAKNSSWETLMEQIETLENKIKG